jgi:hypothetical protein
MDKVHKCLQFQGFSGAQCQNPASHYIVDSKNWVCAGCAAEINALNEELRRFLPDVKPLTIRPELVGAAFVGVGGQLKML